MSFLTGTGARVFMLGAVVLCLPVAHCITGHLLAFADLNYDRRADLIVQTDANKLSLYVANDDSMSYELDKVFAVSLDSSESVIFNVAVADFDADSFPDLLVTYSNSSNGFASRVYWGSADHAKFENHTDVPQTKRDQPAILDCDLDQKPDIFGVIEGQCACFNFTQSRNLTKFVPDFNCSASKLANPNAPAFVDVTGDLAADIVWRHVGNNVQSNISFTVWSSDPYKGTWTVLPDSFMGMPYSTQSTKLLPVDENPIYFGQSVFADFDSDGQVDHLVPVCVQKDCAKSFFMLWHQHAAKWYTLDLNVPNWHFWAPNPDQSQQTFDTLNFRAGDFDLDGYIDLVGILKNATSSATFVLNNVEHTNATDNFSRTFIPKLYPILDHKQHVSAAFFDLQGDGSLDVVVETTVPSGSNVAWSREIELSQSKPKGDTSFLKVEVYTSTCLNCASGSEGTGISLIGACLKYDGTNPDGSIKKGATCQQPLTSYNALQVPYAIFGLGRTPNFVEQLYIGIPDLHYMNRSWPQIIPNSRLYVIPHPHNNPNSWSTRMYVTPNRLILLSVAVLSCVCGIILLIILALYACERRQDKKERLEESQRLNLAF